jgi:hypothetical protein
MKTRFDLEQEILECWGVTTDIDVLFNSIKDKNLSQSQILEILNGIKVLYDLKFDSMFNTFESVILPRSKYDY